MERNKIIDLLCDLNKQIPSDPTGNFNFLLEKEIENTSNNIKYTYEKLCNFLPNVSLMNQDDTIWNYLCVNIYALLLLKNMINNTPPEDVLSVQQSKNLSEIIKKIIRIGICSNIQPNLPEFKDLYFKNDNENIVIKRYSRLVLTTLGLIICGKCPKLYYCIFNKNLRVILVALYQLLHAPIKKPDVSAKPIDDFIMTPKIYEQLMKDRNYFNDEYKGITGIINKFTFYRETMLILTKESPLWFKKAISRNLTGILISEKGLENIARAMFDSSVDYDPDDRTKNWKTLYVIMKLIMSLYENKTYQDNICNQVLNLLKVKGRSNEAIIPFERIFVLITKNMYEKDYKLYEKSFLSAILEPFEKFTYENVPFENNSDLTQYLGQAIRILYYCFVLKDANVEFETLQSKDMTRILHVIFKIYCCILNSEVILFKNELSELLIKFLKDQKELTSIFDKFFFEFSMKDFLNFNNQIYLEVIENKFIYCKFSIEKQKVSAIRNSEVIYKLLEKEEDLIFSYFIYLLGCLCNRDKYFILDSRRDLLDLEQTFILDEGLERNLAVLQQLTFLSENKIIQKRFRNNPAQVFNFLENFLNSAFKKQLHKLSNFDTQENQTLFTVCMILQATLRNCSKNSFLKFEKLLGLVKVMKSEAKNVEFKELLEDIIKIKEKYYERDFEEVKKEKSEVDKALEDICDPLLPVRGHGVMALAKLVEKKDKIILERKLYVLNIFQQNLKNDDSFIYLSAIRGLAAMGDIFPDTVLNVLCEEYSDFSKKNLEDGNELRMKLGEVLIKVTKILGEIAPKYKSLLLNTFLVGTKDEDHLIRASSLSNLGEICKVLGYKLGTIVTEVLVCVHAIITTDKAVEARRAAVTVLRQLFIGLDSEMITFLKDEILEIYRSLKMIYNNDTDDVMRLQAQLALEELNENVKKFLLQPSSISFKKKVIVLN